MRSRTNQTGPVRVTLPELLQAAIGSRPRRNDRTACTDLETRPTTAPALQSLRAFAFGEGLWDKVRMGQSRRGGSGVKWNRGRASKRFHLRPGPTGGTRETIRDEFAKTLTRCAPVPGRCWWVGSEGLR